MNEVINWQDFELFKGIDLNDSFILDWVLHDNNLIFYLEFSVCQESDYYTVQRDDEWACYRTGMLHFKNVSSIKGFKSKESCSSNKGLDGTVDYGNIDDLLILRNGFKVYGNFGCFELENGQASIEIN